MKKTRCGLLAICLLICSITAASAQISIGISTPNVSIGINLPLYPELVPVPGYPVYYAPAVSTNYFFYDGMYWAFYNDNWYSSYWYNGPWNYVEPVFVPVFILRIPVRYYVRPPAYFHGWRHDAPPRWGHHWGPNWEQRRRGWDRWNRSYVPARAPLPVYQRQYSGDRYPRFEQQRSLHRQNYRHQPRNEKVRRIYRQQMERRAPTPDQRRGVQEPRMRTPRQQDMRPAGQPRHVVPATPRPRSQPRGREDSIRSAPPQQRSQSFQGQRQQPRGVQSKQRPQKQPQEPGRSQGSGRSDGQRDRQDRGGGRDRGK